MDWVKDLETIAPLLFAVLSLFAAGSSAIAAWYAYRSSRRSAARMLRLEWTRDLLVWTNDGIKVLTRAHHLCGMDPQKTEQPSFYNRWNETLTELSAVADRGRMFFVNRSVDVEHKLHNPPAYRGYSPQSISLLTSAYKLLRDVNYEKLSENKAVGAAMIDIKREFVSVMQQEIDPAWFRRAAIYESRRLEDKKTPPDT